jgi:glycosyltransferase involved in cell wall biosynthesis
VPKEDPQALAAALARLADHPEELAAFRGKAPAHLQRFTRKRLIDASERLLGDLVSTATSPSVATRRADTTIGN